ncbi:TIGR02099 family protein [Vibrio sp. CAIM 722]|uniref:TIGR02099 family protein n=1 Tax=Vibrio eleionomae TaxID=2653505 RepID=A0A7X4LIQ7_9VIBR|nr:TIGR02099 family protein [Vibrio eleionomae]
MISRLTLLGRLVLWLLVSLIVLLAVAVTSLRVLLPNMNHFQGEIEQWVSQQTNIQFDIQDVRGFWRNTHPSIALQGVTADFPDGSDIHFSSGQLDIEFDLMESLWEQKPVIADLTIHKLKLDVSSVDWVNMKKSDEEETAPQDKTKTQQRILNRIDSLFLRQLDNFSLRDSTVKYRTVSGETRQLDIDKLRWKNQGKHHFAEGVVSIAEANINSLSIAAQFEDHGSLRDVSGQFYADAKRVEVRPWLTKYAKDKTGIKNGVVNFNAWVTLKHNQPVDGYLELQPSELTWQDDTANHELFIESGIVNLSPTHDGWKVSGHSLKIRTDDQLWPDLDVALDWKTHSWRLNLSQLDIGAVLPLTRLFSDSTQAQDLIKKLKPNGTIEDLRVSRGDSWESLRYSARLADGAIAQWDLLPEVHHLQATISGSIKKANIKASLADDVLPYGDVFQAPLQINHGNVNLTWQNQADGWSLWSNKVAVATPDMSAVGQFRLDMPNQQSPLLSFYVETDLYKAGETWRYLPRLALGQELTDYLSTAIQAGKVNTAKLLWYGRLGDFPYHKHNGIFQAWVGLKDGRFSFDTAWPPLTDLQLNMLFENDAMYLDSHSAKMMDVTAQRITGQIPALVENGHIELEAQTTAEGNAVRNYMTATPLVDSVGAALTEVKINGQVKSHFRLDIPFTTKKQPRAWGWADLTKSTVDIDAPPIHMKDVSGRIHFDNDVVSAAGITGQLLNQPVSLDFKGESNTKGYGVQIDTVGDWDVKPLSPYVGKKWIDPLNGHAPWQMGVHLQLNDVGFTYQVDLRAGLTDVVSQYPYPLSKAERIPEVARLEASGNQEKIAARVELPQAKYQANIDITKPTPVLEATNLVLGKGKFKINPIVGHQATINTDKFNLDKWIEFLASDDQKQSSTATSATSDIKIPEPQQVDLQVKELTLGSLDWHDVDFSAKEKNAGWSMSLNSQEASGKATYLMSNELTVSLDRLHLYVPALDDRDPKKPLIVDEVKKADPLITNFDREFHELMPNLTLAINDFWFQGYKVGQLNMDFIRQGDLLHWKSIDINSGTNEVHADIDWKLGKDTSHTRLSLEMKGENNSDLMDRFGISSGIQKAPFELKTNTEWDGAPWSMRINTLQGDVSTKLGKGVISDVSGAANLLGIFSLDSLIRRMKLDFSDVFDDGMAFNSITGSGRISQGVFLTNDIEMDAVAGDLSLKGMADLNNRTVDAQVHFVPDMTSGIPVLSAFAVAPQTALYVLAITTVISPVVEVFTEVNYEIKGPMDSPTVKEISRSKGEYTLPKELKKVIE